MFPLFIIVSRLGSKQARNAATDWKSYFYGIILKVQTFILIFVKVNRFHFQ